MGDGQGKEEERNKAQRREGQCWAWPRDKKGDVRREGEVRKASR